VAAEGLAGSGPHGRVIERDVQAALAAGQPLTPAAQAAAQATGGVAPALGTGIGGRVTAADLQAKPSAPVTAAPAKAAVAVPAGDQAEVTAVPVKGIRKLIAERMLASLTTTAQLTLNSSADATALLAYRSKLKHSPEELGLAKITVNDLLLFVVARTLATNPQVNALYQGGTLYQHHRVHLAFAVDTPRGLMVPVIRDADRLSLKQLSAQAKRLASACGEGKINPDDLTGGTFTVTNLGSLGVESFTPVLNPPQVAILGVGNTQLKPVEAHGEVKFLPHLGLSLTIDHQVVDGAPGARFLQALAKNLAHLEVVLAL
jgi:pyruvate dehydrogenase E2 component (dihydrolipoamide acetyltransferase)